MPEFLETTIDKFIFRVAADRRYSRDGVWVQECGVGGQVRLGVSDYVQQRSGDAAFVHVKPVGTRLSSGDEFAEMETIKANVGLVSPVAGQIAEVNKDLDLSPENVNQDPYGKGWMAVVQAARSGDCPDLPAGGHRPEVGRGLSPSDRARLLEPAEYLSAMRAQAEEEIGAL